MTRGLEFFVESLPGALPPHIHHNPHACFVIKGEMVDHEWSQGVIPASAGDFFVYPAGTGHTIEIGNAGLECIILEEHSLDDSFTFRRSRAVVLLKKIAVLSKGLMSRNPARQVITRCELSATLRLIARECYDETPTLITEARHEIKHDVNNISIKRLALRSGVHRATLTKNFRDAYGVSPEQIKMLYKLERAATLIAQGLSVAEAAIEAGFSDQPHLNRVWRHYLGSSPKRWIRAEATIVQEIIRPR